MSLFAHLISLHSNDATGFDTDLTSAHSLPTDKKIILTAHRPRGVWVVVFGLGKNFDKKIDQICDQICDQIFIQILPPLIKKTLLSLSSLQALSLHVRTSPRVSYNRNSSVGMSVPSSHR